MMEFTNDSLVCYTFIGFVYMPTVLIGSHGGPGGWLQLVNGLVEFYLYCLQLYVTWAMMPSVLFFTIDTDVRIDCISEHDLLPWMTSILALGKQLKKKK